MSSVIIDVQKIPTHESESLSRNLLSSIGDFYNNPTNAKAFIKWHIEKYGFAPTDGIATNTVYEEVQTSD